MPSDRLYDAALRYKETKLWKKLGDSEMFAVKLSDGKIGYCCVMGMLGVHNALAVYVGLEGLYSYRSIQTAEDGRTEFVRQEMAFAQDCVQCAFENKAELREADAAEVQRYAAARGITFRGQRAYPQFVRYAPCRVPWYVKNTEDLQHIREALDAALEVAGKLTENTRSKLGFTEGEPFDRDIPLLEKKGKTWSWSMHRLPDVVKPIDPSPVWQDDLMLARLKKMKKTGRWACEVVMLPRPVSDEGNGEDIEEHFDAPRFPFLLLSVNCETGFLNTGEMMGDYGNECEKLVSFFVKSIHDVGLPSEIMVRDERTARLLRSFAQQAGIPLMRQEDLPALDEVEEKLLSEFIHGHEDEKPTLDGLVKFIQDMDDAGLKSLPGEIRMQLVTLAKNGVLPEKLAQRVLWLLSDD